MDLIDALKKNSTQQRCTRCEKVVREGEYKQIGNYCLCSACVSAEEKILPEYLLLRTPSLLEKNGASTAVLTCPICQKEKSNPYFCVCDGNDSAYFHTWMGENRLCLLCAEKQLPALNGLDGIEKNNTCFFYPVSDKKAEESYWDEAVCQANSQRRGSNLSDVPKAFERVDRVIILEYYNINNEYLFEDDTPLYVYANAERTLWCFRLEHSFISGWDGDLVYMGGFITPKQFLEFMDKMNLKHHLVLFEKEKGKVSD